MFAKSLLIVAGVLEIASVHADTFKFNNHTVRDLVAKIKVRDIPEVSIEIPARGTGKKSFAATGFAGCTEYIKLRKPNGDVVNPKLIIVNEDKHATFMYKKEMREPINLDELVDRVNYTYTGVVISNLVQVCGDRVFDIFMDTNGDLLLVALRINMSSK
jgi:hypothetical protein